MTTTRCETTETPNLEPCPFCGTHQADDLRGAFTSSPDHLGPELHEIAHPMVTDIGPRFAVVCMGCDARGPMRSRGHLSAQLRTEHDTIQAGQIRGQAVAAWNDIPPCRECGRAWTDRIPTTPGFWFCRLSGGSVHVVEVKAGQDFSGVIYMGTDWAGPIQEPR